MTINDIVQKVYFLTKTDSSSFAAADMLILINNAGERALSIIIKADGRWQIDDSNYTDLPVATTQINTGQRDYTLATSHLKMLRIRIKDSSGNWHVLPPVDVEDENYSQLMESTTTGIPSVHDKSGSSILLGLTPNFTQAASLEVQFQRGLDPFTSGQVSTGTKIPGFNSLYHDLIPLWVAYNYWLINDQNMCGGFMKQIQLLEAAMINDYSMRGKDDQPRFRILNQNNK